MKMTMVNSGLYGLKLQNQVKIIIFSSRRHHCYKTNCEVSGEDASWKIWSYKIQNGHLSAIIHLDRPDIAEYHENRSR